MSSNGEEHLDTALPELHRADAGVSDATPTAIGAESMVIFGTDHLDGDLPSERDGFEFVEGPCAGRGVRKGGSKLPEVQYGLDRPLRSLDVHRNTEQYHGGHHQCRQLTDPAVMHPRSPPNLHHTTGG